MINTIYNMSTVSFLYTSMFPDFPSWTTDAWAILSRLPKLNGIKIGGYASNALSFMDGWMDLLSPSDPTFCFPSLTAIYFQEVRLGPALFEFLRDRSNSSHPLSEVHINHCHGFGRESCRNLRQAAPGLTVVWDKEDAEERKAGIEGAEETEDSRSSEDSEEDLESTEESEDSQSSEDSEDDLESAEED